MIAIGARFKAPAVSVCSVCSAACKEGVAQAMPAARTCTARARGRRVEGERGVTEFCEHRERGAVMRTHSWLVVNENPYHTQMKYYLK
ncbi:hypothetical protein D3C85_1477840 [compost metagenome]